MTIRDIIDLLESQGEWVNRSCTRDRILFGEDQTEISKVITCWVATNKVIQYAIEHDIHFIISHENPFYLASTTLPTLIYRAQKEKEADFETLIRDLNTKVRNGKLKMDKSVAYLVGVYQKKGILTSKN